MAVLDVGIDPGAARAEVEQRDLAHVGEVVDRLVHGLERDRRHLDPGGLVQRLDRGVLVVPFEQPEDRLALGRDPQALGPEQLGELDDGLHGPDSLSTMIVRCQPVRRVRCGRQTR